MSEVYLDKAQSDRVHSMLIKRFWKEQFPELDDYLKRVQGYLISDAETKEISLKMDELMAEWGLRFPRHPEPHNGFVFSDETAHVRFLLSWS